MARRPINNKFQQSLQRQTSVKSNEELYEARFYGRTELQVPIYLDSLPSDGVKNSKRESPLPAQNFADIHSPRSDSIRSKDQLGVRERMEVDKNFDARGSLHQRSFESYDSSMSANSWASSNEPELWNDSPSNSRDSHSQHKQLTKYVGRSTSPALVSYQTDQYDASPEHRFEDPMEQGGNRKIRIPLGGITRQQKSGLKSDDRTTEDTSFSEQNLSFKGNQKQQNVTLKIIGSERDGVSDGKFPVGSGTPNIKGLWKRAFQSLRKDKNKREPSVPKRREPTNQSGEIDPVYHLLRCAASKSQSSAVATSGMGTTPKPMDKSKPNTVDSPKSRIGLESSVKSISHTSGGSTNRKSTNVTFRSLYPDALQTNNELHPRRDSKYFGEDTHGHARSLGHSPSRRFSPNLHPDLSSKDASLLGELGDGILEGNLDAEKSKEAQLAYEQHKRLNARRTMLKNTQKSLSFAVDDDHGIDMGARGKSPHGYNQRVRPSTLGERMKSFSVDDAHGADDGKRWKDSALQRIPRSPQLHTDGQVAHKSKSGYDRICEGNPSNIGAQKNTNKVTLLSTKSFSLDVPGSEKSDESDRVLSGSSSPGQFVRKLGLEQQMRKEFHSSTRSALLSPLSASKLGSRSSSRYRNPAWRTGIQSQPNLDEQKPRYPYQPHPSSSAASRSIGSKFTPGALSSGNIYHANEPYNRRDQSDIENVYFVINDFVPRRKDDLPLRIGQLVRVIESSDKLWWYGSCDGQVGYFPSTFVHRIRPS